MNPEKYEDLLTEPSNQRKYTTVSDGSQPVKDGYRATVGNGDENSYRERISQLELRLAEHTGQRNQEVGKLHENISKLQSSFEKQELVRQKLEYELTVAKQEISKEKRIGIEKGDAANKRIQQLQDEIRHLNSKVESSNQFITEYKESALADLTNETGNRRIAEAANVELKKENEVLYEEKLAAEKLVVTWKRKCEEMQEKCELFEQQRNDHADTIRKLMKDAEFSSEKEEELMSNLRSLKEKIKALEENVEAERAAHLETKFNTEVIQLKLRDTENLLEMEKARLQECRNSLQNMDDKYRDLEEECNNEKKENNQLKLRYEKCTQELTNQKDELCEKDRHLDGITNEVKNYGKHLKEIMEELEETKQKLATVESTKESTTKELKFLLNNYKLVSEVAMSPVKKEGWRFSENTEQLRRILEGYQKKLAQLESKCTEAAETVTKLTEECTTHREIAWSKDRALEEAERLVRNAQSGLSQCQVKCAAYEEKITRLKDQEDQMKRLLVEREEKISALNQEVYRNNMDIDQHFQNTMSILQVIYDLLMMNESAENVTTTSSHLTMKKLKDVILNRIKDDHQNQRVMKEQITMLKEDLDKTKIDLQQHKTGLKKMQKLNSQVLSQTEKSLMEVEQLREKEKATYLEEISFLNSKLTDAEQRFESLMRKCEGVPMDDLSTVVEKLKQYEQHKGSSAVLINLLISSLWGLLFQHHLYARQKKILTQTVNSLFHLRTGVLEVSRTLHDSMSGSPDRTSSNLTDFPKSGIFRFRQIVIVILVVNRLWKIGKQTRCFRLYHKPSYGHVGLLFYKSTGDIDNNEPRVKMLQQWLSTTNHERIGQELRAAIHGSLESIIPSLSTCYGTILQNASRDFKSSSILSLKQDSSKRSLLHLLANGLRNILQSKEHKHHQWASSSKIVEVLRQHILDFTVNLHKGEDARNSLINERDRYRESRNKYKHEIELGRSEIASLKKQEITLNAEIDELKNTLHTMVYKEQLDEVCGDLKNALKREEELQMLFDKQMEQIKEMETRIVSHEECYEDKNNEFAEVAKTLKTAQANVKRRDDAIQELQSCITNLKHERSHLEKCVRNQEEKIGAFICDREILARCMRRVGSVIFNTKKEMHQSVEAINLAMKELVPQDSFVVDEGKDNPEMQLVQNTVKIFLDAQREALLKISVLMSEKYEIQREKKSLQEDLAAHQLHIRSLKDRVSQLFTQDVNIQKDALVAGTASIPMTNEDSMFIPLQEH